MNQIKPAIILFALLTLITGAVYPLVVTVIAKLAFPGQADGSLIIAGGKVVGSRLIGQAFSDPGHFWGRASATSPQAYNASSSSGSNQGPINPALAEAVAGRIKALREADPGKTGPVPVDMVTASGSGLDPHISPAAAAWQVSRVARVRKMDEVRVRQLVETNTEGRQLGVLGEPRVNVLALNLALDKLK